MVQSRSFAAHASEAGDVFVDDPGAFVDIDTPEDYARLTEMIGGRKDSLA